MFIKNNYFNFFNASSYSVIKSQDRHFLISVPHYKAIVDTKDGVDSNICARLHIIALHYKVYRNIFYRIRLTQFFVYKVAFQYLEIGGVISLFVQFL